MPTNYTVRISKDDIRYLSQTELEALDIDLSRIKRSNGDIEYVTDEALAQLEADKRARHNQKKLAAMREAKHQQGGSLRRLLHRVFASKKA